MTTGNSNIITQDLSSLKVHRFVECPDAHTVGGQHFSQNDRLKAITCGHVEFNVCTAMVRKSSTFFDIIWCSPVKNNRDFEGTFHLHLQVEK
jgi:hypothetical protein